MLHEDIANRGITGARRLAEHLVELVAMPGYRAIDRDDIGRTIVLIPRLIDAHGLGKRRPGRTAYKGIVMPVAQIAHTWRRCRPRRIHGRARSHVLDHRVIPGVTVLVAKNQCVSPHGSTRMWFTLVVG